MKIIIFIMISVIQIVSAKTIEVKTSQLSELLQSIDKDKDKKITVKDEKDRALVFKLVPKGGSPLKVQGVYYLSNLLQELKLNESSKEYTKISIERLFEDPVTRISRLIKELYWDALTRRMDEKNLQNVLEDPKVKTNEQYLYVPSTDPDAFAYYQDISKKTKSLELKVRKLPRKISDEYVKNLGAKHGVLSLALKKDVNGKMNAIPYVVPGGRFNELYGWDSYFIVLGLIENGRVDLAKGIIDNLVYEIIHYGKILNANRTYYLTRSQPPFLTSMIRTVYGKLPKNAQSKDWLRTALKAAITEYHSVWMGEERLTELGLSRYAGFASGIPPEVEEGHFDEVIKPFAKRRKISIPDFIEKFNKGDIVETDLSEFFLHDRAMRESGHDTTYRWRFQGKDRCADFVTVDLNSLLLKYELDFAYLIKNEFNDSFTSKDSHYFLTRARKRINLIRKYFWDEKTSLFYDFNWKNKTRSKYLSGTTFFPIWAYDSSFPSLRILSKEELEKFKKSALLKLEAEGGILATDFISLKTLGDLSHLRQWEFPNGWVPHQMLAWQGLLNFDMQEDAQRLIYKWLFMITKNAVDYNGTIPEKYNVISRSHKVFAEYGNVGTEFSYITREGFGWMNASYVVGLNLLTTSRKTDLKYLIPPKK